MPKLGAAATAPFGADVLERLAAEADVAWLPTRPDRSNTRRAGDTVNSENR